MKQSQFSDEEWSKRFDNIIRLTDKQQKMILSLQELMFAVEYKVKCLEKTVNIQTEILEKLAEKLSKKGVI